MKKILVINTKYRNFGGEDSNIHDEIKLLSLDYKIKYLEFDNSAIFTPLEAFFSLIGSNYFSNIKLKKIINDYKPDIAYIHNVWYKANLGIFKVLVKKNIKVVHKIHNFRYLCTQHFSLNKHLNFQDNCHMCGMKKMNYAKFNKYYSESFFKSLVVIVFGKKYLNLIKNLEMKILVLNNFHKKNLENLGIKSESIQVFYNPIELQSINNYDPSSKDVVYAGRLTEDKGLIELLESWKISNTKNLNLIIIGDGELKKDLEQKFKNKNIIFKGYQTNQKTLEYISKARAVVTCTKLYEGQPRLLSEASSMGVPSIFPSFGGMDDYFPNNYRLSFNQFDYSDFCEKINLLNNESLLLKLSKDVYKTFSQLINPSTLQKQFEKIIN